jgi:hypothetical protein
MTCSEYLRLRKLYQAALRRWGEVGFKRTSSPEMLKTQEEALSERNNARSRLWMHELSSLECDRKCIPLD